MKTQPRSLGPRRDRIVFQRRHRKPAPSATGRAQEEWVDICAACPCDLIPLRSGDEVMAGRIAGVTAYRVWVWYNDELASLNATDIAVEIGRPVNRKFKVQSVLIGPERDRIDIVLQEGVPL